MNRLRSTFIATSRRIFTATSIAFLLAAPAFARAAGSGSSGGFVDGASFRALIDESKEVVEVNLDGAILQALAKAGDTKSGENGGGGHEKEQKDLFTKLKSIHAVIGTVKGTVAAAQSQIQKTDQSLVAAGWQRVTRVTDETSTISVLTHTVSDKIDGLVVLIFDTGDKELVFANLAGEIDFAQLGEIGERLNVPGLGKLPGGR